MALEPRTLLRASSEARRDACHIRQHRRIDELRQEASSCPDRQASTLESGASTSLDTGGSCRSRLRFPSPPPRLAKAVSSDSARCQTFPRPKPKQFPEHQVDLSETHWRNAEAAISPERVRRSHRFCYQRLTSDFPDRHRRDERSRSLISPSTNQEARSHVSRRPRSIRTHLGQRPKRAS